MPRKFRLGLIVNPYAGIGGATGFKGSDGAETRQQALAKGAKKLANEKTARALAHIQAYKEQCTVVTVAGEMGATTASHLGFHVEVVYTPQAHQTEAIDTQNAAEIMLEQRLDALVFAGGDGTATDIYNIVSDKVPVLGIPAGCKIHSGVYAVSPNTAGKVLAMMIRGELVTVRNAEVRDIDESAFRKGVVVAKHVGEMQVPQELRYIQAVKMGGKESDELLLQDMGDHLAELFDEYDDTMFVIGSGSTIKGAMQAIGLESTLLGVDLVFQGQVAGADLSADELLHRCQDKPVKIVVTTIGGQGHIFGRGNQQISPTLIRQAGRENIIVMGSKGKLQALDKRPLVIDTGDTELDAMLSGSMPVITGYHDAVLYPISDLISEDVDT
ncbi:ATP-NAD kinase family protein [Alteromonas sp. ASW11-36]|uniref:ATP-NAD kinase family protein n=1 Tax=Alteromonas arenosi TaxID=3055817 RepID=A0ABT7SVU7_9ALTE|nr:ATP-NAD kinase family protein [Alteromonas sp. ASW11-36]MDM7860317.1 ATP-NAD kinase family protein [Alteromonas sp. ASW11-36]